MPQRRRPVLGRIVGRVHAAPCSGLSRRHRAITRYDAIADSECHLNPYADGQPRFTGSCASLLPLDAVADVTYGKGDYRMFDMFLRGAVISAAD
jgi:hypothetical protein